MVDEGLKVHEVVALSEGIGMSLEVADARVVAAVALGGSHDIPFGRPRTGGAVAHGVSQCLGAAGGRVGQIVAAVALVEPRSFLIMLDMRQFCHAVLQRDHIIVEARIERMRISPVHICLSVVVGEHGRVDVEPVGPIPYERFAQRVAERAVGRVGHEDADAVAVERSIEVIFAVPFHGLYGPSSILTASPGEVLE